MQKKLIVLAVASTLTSSSLLAQAPASPHSFTGNLTVASEYLYRGIAQTRGEPALQGGFDYAHASGFYTGVWGSNISWISDGVAGASASLELDVYGGYKGSLGGDLGFDVGVLTYNYPGTGKPTGNAKPDTTEIYGALSWQWLSAKYSHSTSSLFGWTQPNGDKTTGSGYLELNANYDLGNGLTLVGHAGHQKVKGLSDASYSDFRLGLTKDVGFGSVGLMYSTTNAKDSCSGAAVATASDLYCFVKAAGTDAYSAGKDRVVVSFTKTF